MIETGTRLPDIPADLVYSGKVRDTYELDNDRFLMIASDRISAFDVILPSLVPGKGIVLTQLSRFWFSRLSDLVPNHLTGETVSSLGWDPDLMHEIAPRAMIVKRAERIPIECVVRGYLAGSGMVEYRKSGTVGGHSVPTGLNISSQLPEPLFTPAAKNDVGHDENIAVVKMRDLVGSDLTDRLEQLSLAIYRRAADHAIERGVIIADTKFEFGFIEGRLTLIDEVLTPDSSRFWDALTWQAGVESDSFDKQFVRNWLLTTDWNKEPPGPVLPAEVIAGTVARYGDAFSLLTGMSLDSWLADLDREERN